MPTRAQLRDPRSIITPDAFEVSEALLGTPLAPPARRLAALLLDLMVAGLLTLVTKSFGLVLGVVVAVLLVRAGFKRTPVRGSAFGRAMRFSVGCLGIGIGLVTAVVWLAVGAGGPGSRDDRIETDADATVRLGDSGNVVSALRMLGDLTDFREAPDAESAIEAVRIAAGRADDLGVPRSELRDLLLEMVPAEASWAGDADRIVDEALSAPGEEERAGPGPDAARDPAVAGLAPDEALEAYARLLRAGDDTSEAALGRRAELRARLLDEIAGDTVRRLEERLESARELSDRRARTISEMRDASREGRARPSFLGRIRDFADELGFGIGWLSLYLTVMLSWWKGQTVGKRLLGIRVLRLDGEPITWWTAFERAGGYAAGLATGLLGFAQVFWDANRQAIHDRIAGTVVVLDKAPKVANWEEAL